MSGGGTAPALVKASVGNRFRSRAAEAAQEVKDGSLNVRKERERERDAVIRAVSHIWTILDQTKYQENPETDFPQQLASLSWGRVRRG